MTLAQQEEATDEYARSGPVVDDEKQPPSDESVSRAERRRAARADALRAEVDRLKEELHRTQLALGYERQRSAILNDALMTYEDAHRLVARTTNVHVASLKALAQQEKRALGLDNHSQTAAQG